MMLGALGAVTATLPADLLLDWIGWRELFNRQVEHFLARDASLDQERIHALSGQVFG
jgi:hypothetical protein